MPKVTPISTRKSDHIRINLEEDVRSGLSSGLEHYRFIHQAAPELNLEEINLHLKLFGRSLRAPILISSMTGGTPEAAAINRILATAAQETGIAMGLGSQRAAIEHPELTSTFQVRQLAPDVLLFANLGAIQLNYGYTVEHCLRAVEMIAADSLVLHFNALQEAVQPDGDTRSPDCCIKSKPFAGHCPCQSSPRKWVGGFPNRRRTSWQRPGCQPSTWQGLEAPPGHRSRCTAQTTNTRLGWQLPSSTGASRLPKRSKTSAGQRCS